MRDMGNQADVVQRPEAWRDDSQPVVSRIAFISGGMGGIGSAICRRLGRQGHTVVAGCLPDYDKKAEWLEQMRGEGIACTPPRAMSPTSSRAPRCSTRCA